jgi:hypothetical protein
MCEFLCWLPKCLHWPFCPGVFIAILAAVAGAVTFWEHPPRWVKALSISVFLLLMSAEVWMMSIDRDHNDADQASARAREEENFREIASGIQSSVTESERNFSETMSRSDRILSGVGESISTQTGGDSYIYFEINTVMALDNVLPGVGLNNGDVIADAFPHFAGRYPLNHVFVTASSPLNHLQEVDYETMFPNEIGKPIQAIRLRLRPDAAKQFCNIFISASNGSYEQIIFFKKDGDKWLWANRLFKYGRKKPLRTWGVQGFPLGELDDWDKN